MKGRNIRGKGGARTWTLMLNINLMPRFYLRINGKEWMDVWIDVRMDE